MFKSFFKFIQTNFYIDEEEGDELCYNCLDTSSEGTRFEKSKR